MLGDTRMIEPILDTVIQYGIAGIALYMMYSITYNHLKTIQETLIRIEELLKNGR